MRDPGEHLRAHGRWDTPSGGVYIETVNCRSDPLEQFVNHEAHGPRKKASTPSGGQSNLRTVEGDLISRLEMFDESDLDTALARFDELSIE